jgi:hypothetical protein
MCRLLVWRHYWHRYGVTSSHLMGVAENNLRRVVPVTFLQVRRIVNRTNREQLRRGVMELRPIQLVQTAVYVKLLDARMYGASWDKPLQQVEKYEAACALEVWLERCAAKIADRVAETENRLRDAAPEDRFALLDALRTYRSALSTLETELGRSLRRVQRLSVIREQASGQPRLRLVQSV